MADNARKMTKLNTPKATAKWPKLTEPDYGNAQFPKPDGEFSVKLIWDESDPKFQAFQAKMQPVLDRAEAAGQAKFDALPKAQRVKLGSMKLNPLFTPLYDADEEPTGQVELKLSMKAGGVVKKGPREGKRWARKPALFDALGRPIKSKVEIWGGSELICQVSFEEEGYFIPGSGAAGVKLQLEAVQIITLRQGGDKAASDYGFGAHADGFDGTAVPPEMAEEEDEFGESNNPAAPSADPEGSSDF